MLVPLSMGQRRSPRLLKMYYKNESVSGIDLRCRGDAAYFLSGTGFGAGGGASGEEVP
jgi:hypothetical protein